MNLFVMVWKVVSLWVSAHLIPIIWFIISHASNMSWSCKFSNYELDASTVEPWILLLQGANTIKGIDKITLQMDCDSFLVLFHFFEIMFEWNLLQLVIKNTYSCPNILLNKYENFKVCKFCRILYFILKAYHNFESYKNMLVILGFFFL